MLCDVKQYKALSLLHTFRRIQSPSPAAMFGIVVYKHVVGDSKDVAVYVDRGGHHHL